MTHQITGVGLAAVAAAALDASAPTSGARRWRLAGVAAADADRAGARLYRRTRVERRHTPARVLCGLVRLPLRLLVALPHRGPTHSLLGCVIAAAMTGLVTSRVAPSLTAAAAAGIAAGSLAHVAGDACTPAGVPLHWPLSRRRRWLLPAPARIPTGSLREYALTALLTVVLVAALGLLSR